MKVHNGDIYMTRGDTECIRITQFVQVNEAQDDIEKIKMNDNSYEFTPFEEGDVVQLTIRKTVYKKEIILSKSISEIADDGRVYIRIEPEDTHDLEFGEYVYDVQVTYTNGDVKTLISPHRFVIGGEVTWD